MRGALRHLQPHSAPAIALSGPTASPGPGPRRPGLVARPPTTDHRRPQPRVVRVRRCRREPTCEAMSHRGAGSVRLRPHPPPPTLPRRALVGTGWPAGIGDHRRAPRRPATVGGRQHRKSLLSALSVFGPRRSAPGSATAGHRTVPRPGHDPTVQHPPGGALCAAPAAAHDRQCPCGARYTGARAGSRAAATTPGALGWRAPTKGSYPR